MGPLLKIKSLFILSFVTLILLSSCEEPVKVKTIEIPITLSGDMLFEGANSLQNDAQVTLKRIFETSKLRPNQISGIQIGSVEMLIENNLRPIIENFSLQLVSNNFEMTTLGAINPIPEGKVAKLNLAEAKDIFPYLQDDGATWVLDANLSEDHFDKLSVSGNLTFTIEYN